MKNKRVVVTGLGMLSPLGLNVEQSWQGLKDGRSGIRKIELFDASQFNSQIAGYVENFDVGTYLEPKEARKLDLFVQYGFAAACQAIDDAGLSIEHTDPHRIGVAVGSGIGGLPMIEKNHSTLLNSGARKISPFFIPGAIINMVAGYIAIKKGFKGPNISIVTACTTGTHNIGEAARMICYGSADVMVAGGAEMATSPLGIGGFAALRALSTRNDEPEKASRPWDKDRDGFVLGDGAGVLVLEEYEHAKRRGATIYAELVGYGVSADAYHMTSPEEQGEGAEFAMRNALADADMQPEQVNYINAHGTSTPAGDIIEARAIKRTFATSQDKIAVSSTKSMTGHLLGAAGAVEAIISVLSIRDQIAPPTLNLDNPDVDCDLDFVPHQAKAMPIEYALSNSFGFGGTNGSLIFKKHDA